ncbi:MAG: DNA-binding response OmpR family regulator [Paracoccaceae bacterium]|jgi:DNA-binding response OmpR family regulator
MSDQKRLLVVDDHVEITDLIREIAVSDGYEVHALNQSSLFFKEFENIDPDIVCIDIHMPDVDGIEILRWLSDHKCGARIVILSGGDPLFTKVAERIGEAANLHIRTLVKPFSLSDFREVLREIPVAAQGAA